MCESLCACVCCVFVVLACMCALWHACAVCALVVLFQLVRSNISKALLSFQFVTTAAMPMRIAVRSLTGQIVSLDVEPSDTINNVIDAVQRHPSAWAEAPRCFAQQNMVSSVLRGCNHGGLRLFAASGSQLVLQARVSDLSPEDFAPPLAVVIRKQFNDFFTPDDKKMMEQLVPLVQRRVVDVKTCSPGASHARLCALVDVALTPPPAMTLTLTSCPPAMLMGPMETLRLSCQLIFGTPLLVGDGARLQGLTYCAHMPPPAETDGERCSTAKRSSTAVVLDGEEELDGEDLNAMD